MATLNGTENSELLIGNGIDEDVINALEGDDTIQGAEGFSETIDGGAGRDTLSYANSSVGVSVYFDGDFGGYNDGSAYSDDGTLDSFEGIEALVGSAQNDHVDGSALDFAGLQVDAGAGDDFVYDGNSDDTIDGGDGDDHLRSSGGSDSLQGGEGNDTFDIWADYLATPTTSTVDGGAGIDRIIGIGNIDLQAGSITPDGENNTSQTVLFSNIEEAAGSYTNDHIRGDGGDNFLLGDDGADTILGGDGNDTIFGYQETDQYLSEGDNDVLNGEAGDDYIRGGAGSGRFVGGSGNDTIDGGSLLPIVYASPTPEDDPEWVARGVRKVVDYSDSTGAVSVNLTTGTAQDGMGGIDTLININFVRGSVHNDVITGSSESEWFEWFEGGAGNDTIDGGAIDALQSNNNRVNYTTAGSGVDIDLGTGVASDGQGGTDTLININQVNGSNHADTLIGSNRTDVVEQFFGRAGSDFIDGKGGEDRLDYTGADSGVIVDLGAQLVSEDGFGGGADTVQNIEHVRGTRDRDTIIGDASANMLEGANGADLLSGAAGNDTLIGGNGNDTLAGGAGDDLIDGLGVRQPATNGSEPLAYPSEFNEVSYADATTGVSVNLATGSAQDGSGGTDTLLNIQAVRGSDHDDVLTGSNSTDTVEEFEGGAGNDTINGQGGLDVVRYGGATGPVTVDFGTGTATGAGVDSDTFSNVEGVSGSAQDDTITGGGAFEFVDYASSGAGVAVTLGASGAATGGANGTDTLINVDGVRGSSRDDTLTGSERDEWFAGGLGSNTISGGDGVDWVDYQGFDGILGGFQHLGVEVDLAAGTAVNENNNGPDSESDLLRDTLSGIENVRGTQFYDRITGNEANNLIEGLDGEGELIGGGGNDTIIGGASSDSPYFGLGGGDVIDGGAGDDSLMGEAGSDQLHGGSGNDFIDGGAIVGDDINEVGYSDSTAGVDVNLGTGVADDGMGGADTLVNINKVTGSGFDDTLTGSAIANRIETFVGGEGADNIDGGAIDAAGGNGNLLMFTDNFGATTGVVVNFGTGEVTDEFGNADTIANINMVRSAFSDDLLIGSNTTAHTEVFFLTEGNDTVDGMGGEDLLSLRYAGGSTVDLETGTADAYGGAIELHNIEHVEGSDMDDTLLGSSVANRLDGGDRDDRLEGRGGADTLRGGAGTDTLEGGSGDDILDGGDGWDAVYFSDSVVPSAGVQIDLAAGTAVDLSGTHGSDGLESIEEVHGSSAGDTIVGASGVDEMFFGRDGNDSIHGGGGNDRLHGDNGDDTLIGGGGGHDFLTGGAGADRFVLNAAPAGGTSVSTISDFGEGNDRIVLDNQVFAALSQTGLLSSESFVSGNFSGGISGAAQEADDHILYDTASGDLYYDEDGSGSTAAVMIAELQSESGSVPVLSSSQVFVSAGSLAADWGATTGDDSLTGSADNDTMVGLAGNDTITGGEGNDLIDGGEGNDSLVGGSGDDALTGGTGADTLLGGAGNDIYYVDDVADRVIETTELGGSVDAGGRDTVKATISYTLGQFEEELELSNGMGDLSAIGNAQQNDIEGNDGNNLLDGKGGGDSLIGREGDDAFRFSVLDGSSTTIQDFGDGNDRIELDNAAFSALTQGGTLGAGNFVSGDFSAGINNAAQDADDHILYDNTSGLLYYDADGNGAGAAVQLAKIFVDSGPQYALAHSEIVVIQGEVAAPPTEGDDTLLGTSGNDSIAGLAGNDGIDGLLGNDTLDGGDGDDRLSGGSGADSLLGGDGSDIVEGGAGNDTMDGGAQFEQDTLSYANSSGPVEVEFVDGLGGTASDGEGGTDAFVDFERIEGSAFGDVIDATASNSDLELAGGNGADTILAGMGYDTLTGGAGDDSLDGGDGWDELDGGEGADFIQGGLDLDRIRYDAADTVDGGEGVDRLYGIDGDLDLTLAPHITNVEVFEFGAGNNNVRGDSGDSVFVGGAGSDTIDGGSGFDRADYSVAQAAVTVTLDGSGSGTAQDGQGGVDSLLHIEGVRGSSFSDRLTGSDSGALESFEGRAGNDTIDGKGGTDRVDYESVSVGVQVSLLTGTASDGYGGTDRLLNIEDIRGSFSDDSLTGSAVANRIEGRGGDDLIDGRGGLDTLDGGGGSDTYLVASSSEHAAAEFADSGVDGSFDSVRFTATTASTLTLFAGDTGLESAAIANAAGQTTGTNALSIDASAVDNAMEMLGNNGANQLTGTAYDDSLQGNAGNDRLDGRGGDDQMWGGTGNDTYVVDSLGDAVNEEGTSIREIDNVEAGVDWTLGANLENLTLTGSDDLLGTGNALANMLKGNSGANELRGEGGNDTMFGGAGNDTYFVDSAGDLVYENTTTSGKVDAGGTDTVVASVSYTLGNFLENLELADGAGNINGIGNALGNNITGSEGNNVIDGKGGVDTLDGGNGSDVYLVASAAEHSAAEFDDLGIGAADVDELRFTSATAGSTLTLYANDSGIERVVVGNAAGVTTGTTSLNVDASAVDNALEIVGNAGANRLTGTENDDTLLGNGGSDRLDGGEGVDTLTGGSGNDTYVVDDAGDQTVETGTSPKEVDTVESSLDWTLGINLENLTLTGSDDLVGTGNALANTLKGNDGDNELKGEVGNDNLSGGVGNDTLNGGVGSDTMFGGAGDDTYLVDSTGDRVYESTTTSGKVDAGGTDTVNASVNVTLSNFVENLELADGAGNLSGTGNALGNEITGNEGANVIDGKGGVDTLDGGEGSDVYLVASGAEHTAAEFDDAGSGVGDVDQVRFTSTTSGSTLTLHAEDSGIERVVVGNAAGATTGTTSLNVDASAVDNALEIVGNAGANRLTGTENADTLLGNGGSDRLDGGEGVDAMTGGSGNDTYVVDDAADQTVETGTSTKEVDTVESTIDWTLQANTENLVLLGEDDIDGTGNELANTITGNNGNNLLDGGLGNNKLVGLGGNDTLKGGVGADQMLGGAGNDVYIVDNLKDTVVETTKVGGSTDALGTDRVESSVTWTLGKFVENLELTGSGNINGTGNTLANEIEGNAGNNLLNGGAGSDTLTGGGGDDIFRFATTLNASTNLDTVTDFGGGDKIQLENSVFTKLKTSGVTSNNFVSGDGAVAADADDYLVYDTADSTLYYDSDGSGVKTRVAFADLDGANISHSDFLVT